jgi:serine protease Do
MTIMVRKTTATAFDGAAFTAGQSHRRRFVNSKVRVSCWVLLALCLINFQAQDPPAAAQESPSAQKSIDASTNKTQSLPPAPKPLRVRRTSLPPAFDRPTPTSLRGLKTMEQHFKELVDRVSPAVVCVQVGLGAGSGVVISEDGLVLTAAHVCGEPDLDVIFNFPDGKTARGKTLGTNHELDAGLMKITDRGKWPHVEIGELDSARIGDWVLALGHPGGFEPQRGTVVRLGRIIRLQSAMLQSDCTLVGGDSGGPLFDMHGRVIGIHSRISDSTTANFHVAIEAYLESWDRLVRSESWGGRRPRAYIGANGVDEVDGCKLDRIDENSPASKAGLKIGDLVVKVNDQAIANFAALRQRVARSRPGDELAIQVKRDEKELTLKVTVGTTRRSGFTP